MRWVAGAACVVLSLALLVGCKQPPQEDVAAPAFETDRYLPLTGKRVLMVVPTKRPHLEVYDAVCEAVVGAGGEVVVCSLNTGTVTGAKGRKIEATIEPGNVSVHHYVAVVFGGGPGMARFTADPGLVELASKFHAGGKYVAAVGRMQEVLAHARLVQGVRVAGAKGSDDSLKEAGATVTSQPLELDGRLITARRPEAAAQLAQTLVEVLSPSAY